MEAFCGLKYRKTLKYDTGVLASHSLYIYLKGSTPRQKNIRDKLIIYQLNKSKFMRKLMLFLAMLCMSIGLATAQNVRVSGTVVSAEDGEPVVGAVVRVKGTQIATTTNQQGAYVLNNVPRTAKTLSVTVAGMVSSELPVNPVVNFKLSLMATDLDEAMVVAYGTARRSTFTGSAAVIKAEKLEDRLVSNVTNAISGTVAGVQTLNANGQPGTGSTVLIRGVGSLNGTNNPLYVVDGIPFDGDISTINPQDIESMTVQKDAAAAALYGARGANGVIMITTKKGKSGDAKVTLDARWGVNGRMYKNYDVINDPATYLEALYSALYNRSYSLGNSAAAAHASANAGLVTSLGYPVYTVPTGQDLVGLDGKLNPAATLGYSDGTYFYRPDDWEKETFSNELRQEYNLSVSGATDKLNYYFSAGFLSDDGVIRNSGFKRLDTRLKVDYQVKKWLNIGANLSYTNTDSRYPDEQTTTNSSMNSFMIAYNLAPVYPLFVRNADGSVRIDPVSGMPVYDYGDGLSTPMTRNSYAMSNPISDLYYNKTSYLADVFDGKWFAKVTPLKGLTLTAQLSTHIDNTRTRDYGNPFYGQSANYGGTAYQAYTRFAVLTQQYLAYYEHAFDGGHNMDLTAGYEATERHSESVSGNGQNLYNPYNWTVNNTIDNRRGYGSYGESSIQGYFFRANYNYQEKYFASASVRRDGSSNFHPDHRWGTFWSASAAWEMSKEPFLRTQRRWINLLKLRASFGQQGNSNLGLDYAPYYLDWYSVTGANGTFSDGVLVQKGNKDITWETHNNINVGLDFTLWHGVLSGSVEYFSRKTVDMLYYKHVASSNGYSSIPVNMGSLRNSGLEIDLNSTFYRSQNNDVVLKAYANATMSKRVILELAEDNGEYKSNTTFWKEGETPDRLNLVRYAGVDKTTGEALYWALKTDANGDPIPGTEYATPAYLEAQNTNLVVTGDLTPDVYGGFGLSAEAYGFDFTVGFTYQLGGQMYDNTYASMMHGGSSSDIGQAWHKDILNAWTPTNVNTNVPRLNSADQYTNSRSDRFLVTSNYVSLNNITLGYTLPESLVKRAGLSSVRVYGSADNVALFCARKGSDPRQGRYITDGAYTYTPIRTFSFGLKLSF